MRSSDVAGAHAKGRRIDTPRPSIRRSVPGAWHAPLGARLPGACRPLRPPGIHRLGARGTHCPFEDEVVRRRRWLTHEQFPRPARNNQPDSRSQPRRRWSSILATNGRGWPGMVVAGVAFILPASCIVGVCLALRAVRGAASGGRHPVRGEAGGDCDHRAEPWWRCAESGQDPAAHGARRPGAVAVFLGLGELETLVLAGTAMAFISAARTGIRQHWAGLTVLVAVAG